MDQDQSPVNVGASQRSRSSEETGSADIQLVRVPSLAHAIRHRLTLEDASNSWLPEQPNALFPMIISGPGETHE
jgi:hypothetical protein